MSSLPSSSGQKSCDLPAQESLLRSVPYPAGCRLSGAVLGAGEGGGRGDTLFQVQGLLRLHARACADKRSEGAVDTGQDIPDGSNEPEGGPVRTWSALALPARSP